MSFVLDANSDRPLGLFLMDDSTPVQDYSAFNRTGTISGGTPDRHPALVKGATYAQVLKSSITAAFDTTVFVQGSESQEFTLEAVVRPICVDNSWGEQQVLGTHSNMDGLTVNGTVVSFVTKYLTAPEARVSFDTQVLQSSHIIGVHTDAKNSLYVNGMLVGEVELTFEQQTDQFNTTDGKLYSGATAGLSQIAVNAIAYYDRSLTAKSIGRHFFVGRDVCNADAVGMMFGGLPLTMSYEYSDIFTFGQWETTDDWNRGQLIGTAVQNSQLVPQDNAGVSLASTWLGVFNIAGDGSVTSLYGASLDWAGIGVTLETSVDGTTWSTAVRGVNVSTVPAGFNPVGKQLFIRATFAGGIANDPSFLDTMTLRVFKTGTTPTTGGRPVTMVNAYRQEPADPIEFREDWGAQSASGGTITIGADPGANPINPRTVELWIKALTTTHPTFSITGTFYQNGVSSSSTLPADEWTLLHIVTASAVTGSIVITGAVQLGAVNLYPAALSSSDVTAVSNAYTKANPLKVGDNSSIAVTQTGDRTKVYAFDWAILSAG